MGIEYVNVRPVPCTVVDFNISSIQVEVHYEINLILKDENLQRKSTK